MNSTEAWATDNDVPTADKVPQPVGYRILIRPKGVIEKTFNRIEQTDFPDINKWNPADIWAVDESKISSYDFNQVKQLPYYNQLLLQAYKNRDIIGVSLKKTKKAISAKIVSQDFSLGSPEEFHLHQY